ncbi:ABC transporter ATP-binding protein [Marinithermus hydrothermalis]|uniref:Sulfate-transporting ATPase n=1 Tax=Marinithermus hydrothermalis (strain DSM 14884 / JCM 11576 / T1) TaxID=869210 RepID=F2NP14_MARHT|nr:ABC transporter ATP-binding protein [Marinithermus hydrothermalis]AEB11602.1 Sulfate-transporting ATPase [Marinithermus hydrothermalis DSM 14884]
METIAELVGVSKRFGAVEALREVDLEVHPGELLALLGPNGAGKTTAMSLLLGLRRPDRGRARLFGRDPRDPSARRYVGATPQDTGFPQTLTVGEVVELVRAHYPDPLPRAEVLARFGLVHLERRQTGGLSGGEKRRLAVALAFVGNPRLVVLDEPTTGLDVESRRALWQAVRAYVHDGGTVLLTTHYLEEAEALATRVSVLHQGRVIADGSVDEIKGRVGLKRVRFQAPVVPELPGVAKVERAHNGVTLYTADADQVVRALVRSDVPFQDLEVLPVSLEEAFLVLTGGAA